MNINIADVLLHGG